MKVLHVPDEMSEHNGYRVGVNVFQTEIDRHGRHVVSLRTPQDFPDLFAGVEVTEVEYEPAEVEDELITNND